MRRLLAILLLTGAVVSVIAQRQRTTMHGRLRPVTEAVADSTVTVGFDTLVTSGFDCLVRLFGYDKPVAASRESMHLTNLSDSLTITGIEFEICYLDKSSRELHRRDVTLNHTIAPGRTELVTFPTWDIQRSFYYILSPRPRRQATPYDVRVTIRSLSVCRQ